MAGIQLQVRMLDGFSIKSRSCSRAYHIRAHKNWLLIAYLFLNRDRAVPRSELIALFQDSASSTDPSRMLRNRLFRIRKYLCNLSESVGEDIIIVTNDAARWNPNIMVSTDVDDLKALCIKASREPTPELKSRIKSLYGKGFLPMFHEVWLDELQKQFAAVAA